MIWWLALNDDNFESRVMMANALLYLSQMVGRYVEVNEEQLYDRFLWGDVTLKEWLKYISVENFDFVSLLE
jgi:hypothetical protein